MTFRKRSEPAFDKVEPRSVRRGKVQMIAGLAHKPTADQRGFVSGVVVQHDMDFQIARQTFV